MRAMLLRAVGATASRFCFLALDLFACATQT
jgi:hypothetical protein